MRRTTSQLPLFSASASTVPTREPESGVERHISHNHIHVKRSTFKGGVDAPVHRWFRLTPSFGPDLVRHALDEFSADDSDVVLDPFSGAGTTPIECRHLGIRSFGFEINPFLFFVGTTCLRWDLDPCLGTNLLAKIEEGFTKRRATLDGVPVERCGLHIPTIYNVSRWWRSDVLKDVLLIKDTIRGVCLDPVWREFFRLTLAAVLVPDLTNVTLGRLQLHFIDRSDHVIDAWSVFHEHALVMLKDLTVLTGKALPEVELFHTDATKPSLQNGWMADHVITSPPYPNRYSYVWNTRPHLYMLDFFSGKTEASDLDKKTIGGTWGTATSILAKGEIAPDSPGVADAVGSLIDTIRAEDRLMANYVMKYFNLLARQIVAMDRLVTSGVKVAYVVGNSRVKGVYVETDVILGKMFETLKLGYNVTNIERFRKRNSGVDLFETIVFAAKRG